jgi:hypothetical protein
MLRETKTCEASCRKVAGWPWNGWPDVAEISGRMRVERVAGWSWNQWPDGCGICTFEFLIDPDVIRFAKAALPGAWLGWVLSDHRFWKSGKSDRIKPESVIGMFQNR